MAVDFPELYHIGYTFSPRLNYNRKVDFWGGLWRLGLGVGLEYGSEVFHIIFITCPVINKPWFFRHLSLECRLSNIFIVLPLRIVDGYLKAEPIELGL